MCSIILFFTLKCTIQMESPAMSDNFSDTTFYSNGTIAAIRSGFCNDEIIEITGYDSQGQVSGNHFSSNGSCTASSLSYWTGNNGTGYKETQSDCSEKGLVVAFYSSGMLRSICSKDFGSGFVNRCKEGTHNPVIERDSFLELIAVGKYLEFYESGSVKTFGEYSGEYVRKETWLRGEDGITLEETKPIKTGHWYYYNESGRADSVVFHKTL